MAVPMIQTSSKITMKKRTATGQIHDTSAPVEVDNWINQYKSPLQLSSTGEITMLQ